MCGKASLTACDLSSSSQRGEAEPRRVEEIIDSLSESRRLSAHRAAKPRSLVHARAKSQRADYLSIVGFAEGLQGLSADVSLRSQAENCLRICFIVRRLDYADQVVAAHRQVRVLDFNSGLLEGFAASFEPARTGRNTRNSLAST